MQQLLTLRVSPLSCPHGLVLLGGGTDPVLLPSPGSDTVSCSLGSGFRGL